MPADADVEGGYGAGGVGAGMGSGHGNQNQGSPSGGHPDNDPSTGLSYGSNQTEADLSFDFGNLNQIGIQGPFDNNQKSFGSPTGAHPDSTTNQNYGTGISYGSNQTEADLNFQDFDAVENAMRSTLYGAYDGSHLTGVVQGIHSLQNTPPKELDKNIETFNKYDRKAFKSKIDEFGLTEAPAFDPSTSLETAQFDMDALNAHLQSQNTFGTSPTTAPTTAQITQAPYGLDVVEQENIAKALAVKNAAKNISLNPAQQKQLDRAIAYEAVVKGMPIYGTGGGFAAKSATGGKTNPHAPAFSAKFGPSVGNVFEGQTIASMSQAPPSQDDPNTAIFGSASTAPTTAPTDISLNPAQQKQLDRAIAYEAAIKGKTGMLDAYRDLMSKLEETETKTIFGIEFKVAKLSKFAKEKALVAFREKYGKQIEAYNKHYSKQEKTYREKPGLINPAATLAGLAHPILGMIVRAGQAYGLKESDVEQALTAAEIDAGIREADHGEGVDQATCEAHGYTWNEGLQACYRSDGTLFAGSWRKGNTGT